MLGLYVRKRLRVKYVFEEACAHVISHFTSEYR